MTEETTQTNETATNDDGKQPKNYNKLLIVFIVIALGYNLITTFSDDDDNKGSNEKATILNRDEQKAFEEADQKTQDEINPIGVSGPVNNEAIITLNTQLNSLKNKYTKLLLETRKATLDRQNEMSEFRNQFNSEMGKLTTLIGESALNRTSRYQQGLDPKDDIPSLSIDDDEDANYESLPSDGLPNLTKKNKLKKSKDFDYKITIGDPKPASPPQDEETSSESTDISFKNVFSKPPVNLNGEDSLNKSSVNTIDKNKQNKLKEIVIGNGAYVRAKLLHGVDCPIGGKSISSLLTKAPVVIPVISAFKVNGRTFTVPKSSFAGVCIGFRSTERAIFKFEGLSYYDATDTHRIAPTNAHITDAEDNSTGVKGTLISTRGSDMFKTASAAGVASFASALSGNEITNLTSLVTSTSVATVTGNKLRAAGLSGFGDALGQISGMLVEDAKASLDVVHVAANTEVIIYLDTPMTVYLEKEEDISSEDELI